MHLNNVEETRNDEVDAVAHSHFHFAGLVANLSAADAFLIGSRLALCEQLNSCVTLLLFHR